MVVPIYPQNVCIYCIMSNGEEIKYHIFISVVVIGQEKEGKLF